MCVRVCVCASNATRGRLGLCIMRARNRYENITHNNVGRLCACTIYWWWWVTVKLRSFLSFGTNVKWLVRRHVGDRFSGKLTFTKCWSGVCVYIMIGMTRVVKLTGQMCARTRAWGVVTGMQRPEHMRG